jgi:hypothetical protein
MHLTPAKINGIRHPLVCRNVDLHQPMWLKTSNEGAVCAVYTSDFHHFFFKEKNPLLLTTLITGDYVRVE